MEGSCAAPILSGEEALEENRSPALTTRRFIPVGGCPCRKLCGCWKQHVQPLWGKGQLPKLSLQTRAPSPFLPNSQPSHASTPLHRSTGITTYIEPMQTYLHITYANICKHLHVHINPHMPVNTHTHMCIHTPHIQTTTLTNSFHLQTEAHSPCNHTQKAYREATEGVKRLAGGISKLTVTRGEGEGG